MRSFFQIHLSTVVACLLLLGLIAWPNFSVKRLELTGYIPGGTVFMYGWPWPCLERTLSFSPWHGDSYSAWRWDLIHLFLDCAVALGSVVATAIANERLIRRKKMVSAS